MQAPLTAPSDRRPRRPIRGWTRRLLGLFIGLIITIALLEGSTRLFGTVEASITKRDAELGFTFLPNIDRQVFNAEAGRPVRVRTNSLGFRGTEFAPQPAEGTTRIAFWGDSMVAGLQVEEEATASFQLEALLRTRLEEPVEVLNFGLNASSTGQALQLYDSIVAEHAADLVIYAFFVGNDFADNVSQLTNARRVYFELDSEGELQRRPGSRSLSSASNWLNRHSRFYVWQKRAIRQGHRRLSASAPGDLAFDTSGTPRLGDAWELNEALIAALRTRVESEGAEFLLVLLPSAHSIDPELFRGLAERLGPRSSPPDIDHPGHRIAAVAEAHSIPFLDLTPVFRHARDEQGASTQQLFLGGIGHFTEKGHALVAEHVAAAVSNAWLAR